jgi:hypothetical protein
MSRNDDLLRGSLRSYATKIAATHAIPPASGIWLMAERRRRRLAVQRAALPLRLMQAVSLLCAVGAAVWLLRGATGSGTGANASGLLHQMETLGAASAVMACGSLLLVVAGCWAMLAAGRRVSSHG